MPPRGAPTRLKPMRLQTINTLRIKSPNKHEPDPCLTAMSGVLSELDLHNPTSISNANWVQGYPSLDAEAIGLLTGPLLKSFRLLGVRRILDSGMCSS